MYTEKELVRIAKRENNTKRKYLVVNALQGKHIPVKADEAFGMFRCLADKLRGKYENERILLIGFAETATAIGAALAVELEMPYIQTTREIIDGVDYLFFTEAHSHATEQKLVKDDIDAIAENTDRIIFIEDEVTTGNTILDIIGVIKKNYGERIEFSVASLLNGMDGCALKRYSDNKIDVHFLVKTSHSEYTEIAEKIICDGKYHKCDVTTPEINFKEHKICGRTDARHITDGADYHIACHGLWLDIKNKTDCQAESILVIGTEECMYPALYVSAMLEKNGIKSRCHSTTRSPIDVSRAESYPLRERYELVSLYDDERKTFIYDIEKYDKVFIVTDSEYKGSKGVNSLINALCSAGNTDVSLIRWCSDL